mmetsp:Transcript_29476/g.44546  ORF Transcript_29476/g.44546 Transcript_29476/m.44546 type:complete len:152 (+) Transcript_29476:80-535(+)
MDTLNNITAGVFNTINDAFTYMRQHAWLIIFVTGGTYYAKVHYIDPLLEERKRQISYRDATNPRRVNTLEQDMKRVRALQQEQHKNITAQAVKVEKKKKSEEMEKKRVKQPMETKGGAGQRLGRGDGDSAGGSSGGYNPMNPWSTSTSGYR